MVSQLPDATEAEHQALDLLDDLALGPLWLAAHRGSGEGRAAAEDGLKTAIQEAGEDPAEVEGEAAIAAELFRRHIAALAPKLLRAARELATSDAPGELDEDTIARLEDQLRERPSLAPAISATVESVGMSLGLDRDSVAWAVLIAVGEEAADEAPEELLRTAEAIEERLRAALDPAGAPLPLPLRVFRSAAVASAGPELRARFLARDQPELIGLARELVRDEALADPVELVAAFDERRALLEREARARADSDAAPEPEPEPDGPKRKFTLVHLALALLVLGLTLWHYLLR